MSKVIVITGSTKGIGYGLAEEFLKLGQRVVVSGRKQDALDQAVAKLSVAYTDKVVGCLCDVSKLEDHERLFAFAKEKFGRVDYWINNAGVAHQQRNLWELSNEVVETVVKSNVLGSLYGTRTAYNGMMAQGGGWIYNFEGFGSNGNVREGITLYGMTKAAIAFMGKSLAVELKDSPVKTGLIQPGMVITDMVTGQYSDPQEFAKVKPIFNIIASRLEDVVPVLAEKILTNETNGARIDFLPRWKLMMRFFTAPFVKRNVFDDKQK
ncbi:MAG: SDR family oxidoreductase [Anaerolineae bacterium]|nr:SDR family oxidoreductase [Anaerolineae bacterium]